MTGWFFLNHMFEEWTYAESLIKHKLIGEI
jgi:hypothetical protein